MKAIGVIVARFQTPYLHDGHEVLIDAVRQQHNRAVILPGTHNSTLLREKLSDRVLDTEEFRTGIIYAYSNTYLKVYPTVDIALFRNNRTEILLGKKTIDNKWRLPGGFSDPTDDNYEAAAKRELTEECGELDTTPMQYEGSFRMVNEMILVRETANEHFPLLSSLMKKYLV